MKALQAIAAAALAVASLAAHAVGQRADVSIYDRATGRTLPVHWHEGRAYVVGRPGNEYQVIVKNRLGEDLLAVVSVDGLNVMNGQAASPRQAGYIVAPWTRIDIKGWRKSMEETAAFYFTSLADSYAGRTGRPGNVGVIGVALFQRKREYFPPGVAESDDSYRRRQDEVRSKVERAEGQANRDSAAGMDEREKRAPKLAQQAPSTPLGTGHGRREESRVQFQSFDRSTEAPVEAIAIYYDSYRNLVAQGVLASPAAPRDPSPFPARFVPDPPR
jgi:hypothetical protein